MTQRVAARREEKSLSPIAGQAVLIAADAPF